MIQYNMKKYTNYDFIATVRENKVNGQKTITIPISVSQKFQADQKYKVTLDKYQETETGNIII